MRVLMVTPYVGTTYGGTSKVVKELATSLGRLNLQIDLVTTRANNTTILQVPLGCWLSAETYRVRYFSCWHRKDLILSVALMRWLALQLKNYDLVHTHTAFAPIVSFTYWLCRLYGIPYITTPHGMLEPWALGYKARKKRFYFNWIEKPGLRGASAIHAIATPESEHIKALGFAQAVLVHNGLHPQNYKGAVKPELFYEHFPCTRDKSIVLFLGRIDPKKGLDLLAHAFAMVKKRFPNAHLVVAGPDSINFMPAVQEYFAQANCLGNVTFTGMLTGEIKRAALAAATAYVAPSYSEGFSMSVLEGMASGLPCVITTGCNFPEAAQAQVAYVVDINAQAIGNALILCLQNTAEAEAMGRRARDFILENYTWERSAEKLVHVYESMTQA